MSAEAGARGEVVVVGAGAAGLWAAGRAARLGARVLLLEKTARTGTKVLASGGTRCNLTTTLDGPAAARLFGRAGERFLGPAFRALSPAALRERFAELGVATVAAPLEKVFPASQRARDVRDALEREASEAGARIRCGAAVAGVEAVGDGWRVRVRAGDDVDCARLVLCPGGMSYPRTGTTGDGYAWLAALGLEVVAPAPALAPLESPAEWVRALAGVALQDVEARLVDAAGRELGRRRRPLLFTHSGVSGPAAMDLSRHVARGAPGARLVLDLCPDLSRERLRAELIAAAGRAGSTSIARAIPFELPRRAADAAGRQAGLANANGPLATLERAARHALVEALKGLELPISGTLGFERAEVTAGGLALGQVDPGSMAVRGRPGLYVCGELLDLDGPIGGLNFQAAFATAELAARHAARPATA